jgi:hypothetical protein
LSGVIGRSPAQLTIQERRSLAGKWIALEVYTPKNLALRKIEAFGDSAADCMRQLAARGLDPTQFEFVPLVPMY